MSNKVPYVVTDDLEIVFSYLNKRNITPPDSDIVRQASEKIRASLKAVFSNVDVVPASRIASYLNRQASRSACPVISLTGLLDDRLAAAAVHLSRSVRKTSAEIAVNYQSIGMMPRTQGDLPYDDQFDQAADLVKSVANKAVLIDDVVFSGGTILSVAGEFLKRGVQIEKVIASVAIEAAIPKLDSAGIEVLADIVYPEVHDEVCMRDFIVGAPEGGRNVISLEGYYEAAPYIAPYGDVESWASIPGNVCREFSRVATLASLEIWRNIEKLNGRAILVGELSKPVVTMSLHDSVVKQLERNLVLQG